MGKGETIAKMQIVANRFTNQQLDALDLFSDPAFFINEAMGLDMDKLFIRPGKMVETQGPPEGNIMPISPDLRGIEMGTAKTQELWQWAQMATGIAEDTGMGIAQPGSRETARSVLVRSEAGASRMLLEARLAEVDYVEPLADMFIALDKQHLDLPRQITILGRSAQRDPITGGEIIGRHTLGFSDMQANFDARSRGSITKVSKGVKQQNMVMLLQAAAANPVVAGAVNWLNFFRDTFEIFDVENVNELIETDDAFQRNKAIVNGEPGMAPPDNGSMQEPNNGFPLGQTPGMAPGARVPGAPYGVNSGNMPAMMGRGAA
jgi:hypothetical protein